MENELMEADPSAMAEKRNEEEPSPIEKSLQSGIFPQNFSLLMKCRIRAEKELASKELKELDEGTIVTIEEIFGRRARISKPTPGWMSWRQKTGKLLISQVDRRKQQRGDTVLLLDQETHYLNLGKILDFNEKLELYHVVSEPSMKESWISAESGRLHFLGPNGADKIHSLPRNLLAQLSPDIRKRLTRSPPQAQHQQFPPRKAERGADDMMRKYVDRRDPRGMDSHQQGFDPRYDPRYPPRGRDFDARDPRYRGEPGWDRMQRRRMPPMDPRRHPDFDPRRMMDPREHGRPGGLVDPRDPRHIPRDRDPRDPRARDPRDPRMMEDPTDRENQRRVYEYYLQRKSYDYEVKRRAQQIAMDEDRRRAAAAAMSGRHPRQQPPLGGPQAPPQAPPPRSMRYIYKPKGKNGKDEYKGPKFLVVLRGFPGSGKTMLARSLCEKFRGDSTICSEDRYHWTGGEVGKGHFVFKPEINWQTRDWCAREICDALRDNISLVIVDNINYRIIHYEEHIRVAYQLGYVVKVLEIAHSVDLIPKFRQRCKLNLAEEEWLRLSEKWETDPRVQLLLPGNPGFHSTEKERSTESNPRQDVKEFVKIDEKDHDKEEGGFLGANILENQPSKV